MFLNELNTLLNMYPEDTVGYNRERNAIRELDRLGKQIGYGALEQLCHWLRLVQCDHTSEEVVRFKRQHFKNLGWKLPDNFEEVASKKLP